jgi:hypothetical protein
MFCRVYSVLCLRFVCLSITWLSATWFSTNERSTLKVRLFRSTHVYSSWVNDIFLKPVTPRKVSVLGRRRQCDQIGKSRYFGVCLLCALKHGTYTVFCRPPSCRMPKCRQSKCRIPCCRPVTLQNYPQLRTI